MSAAHLCVLYAQHSRREGEGDQRGREKHFQAGNISFARLSVLVKGVGRVCAEASGCSCFSVVSIAFPSGS